jgi:hypothetical protein
MNQNILGFDISMNYFLFMHSLYYVYILQQSHVIIDIEYLLLTFIRFFLHVVFCHINSHHYNILIPKFDIFNS